MDTSTSEPRGPELGIRRAQSLAPAPIAAAPAPPRRSSHPETAVPSCPLAVARSCRSVNSLRSTPAAKVPSA